MLYKLKSLSNEIFRVVLSRPRYVCNQLLKNPFWPAKRVSVLWKVKAAECNQVELVHDLTGVSSDNILATYAQLKNNKPLYQHLNRCFEAYDEEHKRTTGVGIEKGEMLYLIVKLLAPDIVVETGVAAGESSTFILQALEDNKKGRLYSIDLPSSGPALADGSTYSQPKGKQNGWIVPDMLRHRWHLTLGDSRSELPPLLKELGQIDCFLHDSLHTRDHMLWEYQTAWPFIKEGGVLLSDDCEANEAFIEFCSAVKRPFQHYCTIGSIRK